MVQLLLQTITTDNWREAASLQVLPEQETYIEANAWAIAEAGFYPELTPLAIYNGSEMVGFLMYGKSPADQRWWLLRFMVAAQFQRQGYGRQALQELTARLRSEGISEIRVGFHPDNEAARKLYAEAGFTLAEMAPWGEQTAVLNLRLQDQ